MRIVRVLTVLSVLSVLVMAPAMAEAGALTAKLTDGPGNTGGGEFNLTLYDNGSPVDTFITFCLQMTQYIDFSTTFVVGSITNAADDNPVADPISAQTAWLYTQARSGTLAGYDHSQAAANALQKSFWYLENEIGANPDLEVGNNYDYVAAANAAVSSGQWSGIGNVRVLNLFYPDGTTKAQDQLVLVPEPSTMALFGTGLVATLFRRRRTVRV